MRALRWLSLAAFALVAMVSMATAENQIPWQTNLETAQQIAARTNRLVLVHFWAPWCKPCTRLDNEVFSRPETARALDPNYVMVKLNFDEAPGTARLYGVSSLPTDVIITPGGRLVSAIQSPPTATQYVAQMNQAAAGHRELSRQSQGGTVQPPQVAGAPNTYPASTNVSAIAPQTPPATILVAGNSPAPQQSPYPNDRYAEYYAQQQQAQPQPPQQQPAPQQQPVASYAPPMAPPAVQAQVAAPPQMAPQAAPVYPPQQQQQPPAVQVNPAIQQSQTAVYQAPPQPQIQLPPGSPPLGLDGYCPVTVVERTQWALGDKAWGVVHRGRTYLFMGPEEQKKFWANPDLYSPVLSGNDPVLALDRQSVVAGRREFGVFLDKRIYLFADEHSRQVFEQNPRRYAAEVLQAMR